MNFIEAVKLFQLDKNIKLMRRNNKEFVIRLQPTGGKILIIVPTINEVYKCEDNFFVPEIDDILAEDWYVIKDEKLHSFEEALKAYKSGKSIRRKGYDMVHDSDGADIDRDDIFANDWMIIDKED